MRRTSDGRAFVGRRQFETCQDGRRRGGLATGKPRTSDGLLTGGTRTHNGLLTDSDTDWKRTLDGLLTDFTRTSDGRAAVAGRPPYHGLLTDCTRTIHGLLTGGRWAGIRQTWTNPAITRWAAVWRTRTFHRFHARSSPAFTDAAPAATDETSVVPVAPQRTGHGLITDSTRACGGISRGALRTTRPTMDGRAAVAERPPYHGRATGGTRTEHGQRSRGTRDPTTGGTHTIHPFTATATRRVKRP